MEDKTITINTIDELNKIFGRSTVHTLATLICEPELPTDTMRLGLNTDFYSIVIMAKGGTPHHGCTCCDFYELTLTFHAPGSTVVIDADHVPIKIIAFKPEIFGCICDSPKHSFFGYTEKEALHVSARERQTLRSLIDNLHNELEHGEDHHSRRLLAGHIGLILDYCTRFYQRQFCLRTNMNRDIVAAVEARLDELFATLTPERRHYPTNDDMARHFGLSTPYFIDLMQHEIGRTAADIIRQRLINEAKKYSTMPQNTAALRAIAKDLGFATMSQFNDFLDKINGKKRCKCKLMPNKKLLS